MEKTMDANEMKERTFNFGLNILKLMGNKPLTGPGIVIGRQLMRSATSVGANYRVACKARSKADFISKITISEEEAEESVFWIELLIRGGWLYNVEMKSLLQEAKELSEILKTTGKSAKRNNPKK